WHTEAAERSDETPSRRVSERKVVDRGREDVGDLLRDQLLGRGHPDEKRLVERPDRGARLLPERRVGLVAQDEVVRRPVELAPVTGKPRVGLDRDRVPDPCGRALEDGVAEAVAVTLG